MKRDLEGYKKKLDEFDVQHPVLSVSFRNNPKRIWNKLLSDPPNNNNNVIAIEQGKILYDHFNNREISNSEVKQFIIGKMSYCEKCNKNIDIINSEIWYCRKCTKKYLEGDKND